ncbi:MAG: hypothetical protein ACREKS_13820 [Candidatus Rokuibacteriota bacterium]
MLTFPVKLPPVRHHWTHTQPVVEAASPTSCLARARFSPSSVDYETVVRLEGGKWSVETTPSYHDYGNARAGEIALVVINWWHDTYGIEGEPALKQAVAVARASWLNRAAHKLLTEVGEYAEQIGALNILASTYGLILPSAGAAPTLKGANWATAAHRHLERDVPEVHRRRAVALLVEMITGYREPLAATAHSVAA